MDKRRAAVLRMIGLGPIWRLRSATDAAPTATCELPAQTEAEAPPVRLSAAEAEAAAPAPPLAAPMAPTTERSAPRIEKPQAVPRQASLEPDTDARTAPRTVRIASLDWDALENDIRACRACELGAERTQAVPGVGDRKARWLLVGEGPGREEDLRGEPFVGPAGQLLDRMLAAIGLRRGEDVYIANAIKCRPPHNRTPKAAEVECCLPYLRRQIELLQPTLIVALGRPAALALLGTEISISAARGRLFQLPQGGPPVLVSYHPAYLLRNPQDKAKAWDDLCFARRSMADLSVG